MAKFLYMSIGLLAAGSMAWVAGQLDAPQWAQFMTAVIVFSTWDTGA